MTDTLEVIFIVKDLGFTIVFLITWLSWLCVASIWVISVDVVADLFRMQFWKLVNFWPFYVWNMVSVFDAVVLRIVVNKKLFIK